jgi:hypothetical protein
MSADGTARAPPDLDLAGDRLEMLNLIPIHRTDMGTVQSDDDLALGRLLQHSGPLGVGCLRAAERWSGADCGR